MPLMNAAFDAAFDAASRAVEEQTA